jgi:Uma2 family endonuclease
LPLTSSTNYRYNHVVALTIEESFLPAILTAPPMTDEEFAAFCSEHPDLFFETTATGDLIVMPPNYTLTGIRNGEILRQLGDWATQSQSGIVSDSSTGFVLPNGARRAPDAAWTSRARIAALDPAEVERYWHLTPDFVIELRSHSDRLPVLQAKMREWIENGAALAWLIDPERRAVEIYRPAQTPEVFDNPSSIHGDGPVAGFKLELRRVWEPLSA